MSKTKKGKYHHRDIYLNAALDIIREDGIERLTMRHLAEKLDVSAMAVYKHFANKNELLKALLDAFIARADVLPKKALRWQEWIRHVARRMHDALQGETVFLTVLGGMDMGEQAMEVTRAFLEKMTDSGFSVQQAFEAYMVMIQLVLGSAILQAGIQQHRKKTLEFVSGGASKSVAHALTSQSQIDISLGYLIVSLEYRLAGD
ncbi:MAG: TetR family transcriptional regulator [Ketobacteraceae bacterium]|nr:TetR family transcriptional regulator [Ketobacteraceae bacterium]